MFKIRQDLIRPPRLHSRSLGAENRKVSWLELFYDLVFVAAIAQAALVLFRDLSLSGFFHFAVLFITIWWAWVGHTFYLTRFDTDDLLHRLTGLAQIIAVTLMTVFIPKVFDSGAIGFILSYAVVRLIIVLEYLRAGKHNPDARELTNRYSLGFSIGILVWLCSLFVPKDLQALTWIVAILIDVLTPLTAGVIHFKHPPHTTHLPERFGLFTLIVLGENIGSVVAGVANTSLDFGLALNSFFGLLIAFSIWWIYYDGVRGADSRALDTGAHIRSYQLWMYSHLPLTLSIVVCATGLRHAIRIPLGGFLDFSQALAICGGLSISLFSLGAICQATPNRNLDMKHLRFSALPFGVGVASLLVGALYEFIPALWILFMATLLACFQAFLSMREKN